MTGTQILSAAGLLASLLTLAWGWVLGGCHVWIAHLLISSAGGTMLVGNIAAFIADWRTQRKILACERSACERE